MINVLLIGVVLLTVIYPLYFIVIASISDPNMVNSGQVILFPKGITFEGYERVMRESDIWRGYLNTIIYTVCFTVIGLVTTLTAAYALSRKDFYARNFFLTVFMITTFFGGGMIPTYMLLKNLGWTNEIWSIILPGAVSVYNMIVARTYFQTTIPYELQEAARIDGCSDFGIFFRVMIPLSAPIIAVIALFLAVNMWNSYFSAMMYLTDESKYPLQLILQDILLKQQMTEQIGGAGSLAMAEQNRISELIKYALMLVSTLPIMVVYPFVQKYFVKGMMIGAVKG